MPFPGYVTVFGLAVRENASFPGHVTVLGLAVRENAPFPGYVTVFGLAVRQNASFPGQVHVFWQRGQSEGRFSPSSGSACQTVPPSCASGSAW